MQYLEKYAELLVSYCLQLNKKERLLIRGTSLAEPLCQALQKACLERGVHPEYLLHFKDQDRLIYDHSHDDQLGEVSSFYKMAVTEFDAILTLISPYDVGALASVSSKKKTKRQQGLGDIKKTMMRRSSKGDLRWCLCVYPTESLAKEAGMSLKEYASFVEKACYLDKKDPIKAWQALGGRQQKIVDRLQTYSEFTFKGDRTHLTFSTKGRRWINSDGKRNMPSGEVFSSPVETSVEGQIYFNYPTRYQGQDVSGITLTVKKGVIQSWQAEVGQDALDAAFQIKGARQFGEVAIGTNDQIQTPTKQILFDEKIGGSIHMAVGASYPEAGGKNESALHWDMIKDMKEGGQIEADGRVIYENGRMLP